MWLLLATLAEVPPTVTSACFLAHPLFTQHLVTFQVLIILDLNGIFI